MTPFIDPWWLPVIFAGLMGLSILLYVILDGYDLGVGMLTRLEKNENRDLMVASIGPFFLMTKSELAPPEDSGIILMSAEAAPTASHRHLEGPQAGRLRLRAQRRQHGLADVLVLVVVRAIGLQRHDAVAHERGDAHAQRQFILRPQMAPENLDHAPGAGSVHLGDAVWAGVRHERKMPYWATMLDGEGSRGLLSCPASRRKPFRERESHEIS